MQNQVIKAFYPIIFVAIIHFVLTIFHLYYYIKWIDIPMHLLGGGAVALTTLEILKILKKQNRIKKDLRYFEALFAISITALIAICWEFYEFISDTVFWSTVQMGIIDTLGDFLFGLIGASIIAGWYVSRK